MYNSREFLNDKRIEETGYAELINYPASPASEADPTYAVFLII